MSGTFGKGEERSVAGFPYAALGMIKFGEVIRIENREAKTKRE